MTLDTLRLQFSLCKNWQERYRLLIQLSRQLPTPTPETLANWTEIHGCESRLWVCFDGKFAAYSDARLMQGILQIICLLANEKQASQNGILRLLDEWQILPQLSLTRRNALAQIEQRWQQNYA